MKGILAAAALLVLTGSATRLPEDGGRKTLTQMEMTRRSADELELASMERYSIEHRIMNQPGYEKIEKRFMADCELFEKKLQAEWEKSSEYAGGSMEAMNRNDRMTALVEKRIEELKTQWLAKP